jgi:hypothetical protein
MKVKIRLLIFIVCAAYLSCATADIKPQPAYSMNKEPGPEYQLLGYIYIGKYVMSNSSGAKILYSSAFAAFSEEHLISKMLDQTSAEGGDYLVIDSIAVDGRDDATRYTGIGRVFKLKESYGKAGFILLSDKGHMVQYVMRMEPGQDYDAMKSIDTPSVKTGPKGELTVTGKTNDEVIIILRNSAAEIGGSLVVVDSIDKGTSEKSELFTAKGRIFKLKVKQ